MNPAVYELYAWACPGILFWLMGFLGLTLASLVWRSWHKQTNHHRDSLIGGELPGLPLVLMHSVCFVYSLMLGDWISGCIFGWWGPGFVLVAVLILCKRPIAWKRYATVVSWACKGNYLLLVGLFATHRLWAPVFAYSLWIMHDQVRLGWLQGNADRTRRTLEDWWIPRLCYPLGLTIPFWDRGFPFRWVCAGAGLIVGIMWVWGIIRLIRHGQFFEKPHSFTDNLRDIVYLRPSAQALPPTHS